MKFQIRPEEPRDTSQVRQVIRAAFPGDVESRLVDVLRSHGKAVISLVAVQADRVLGHILFSPVSIASSVGTPPSQATSGLGLAPVAVVPEAQSQGIGSQLIREGLRVSKELHYDFCVVLGSAEYYQRFGFEKANQHRLQNEYGADEEFMVVWFTEHRCTGLVKYASEFAQVFV